MAIAYRPEVDGLRAVAVAAVLVYHAQFSVSGHNPLPGGYLGVDIFFVISGYLISSIILRELQRENFSLLDFYHRRARRILPALFAVILASLIAGWFALTPNTLASLSGSAASALFFGANFWFWAEDSYWAAPGALKPLLHTWTLAVEEQFYIFFPLLLIFLWRRAKGRVLTIFGCLFIFSLLLSQIGSRSFPDANFYLLPTRAWELLAGAMLARLESTEGRIIAGGWRKAMPALGLLLIVLSFLLFNEETPHPSLLTMLPIAGVCLVIWFAKSGDPATALLGSKPFVGVGLVSYSLYLWHYPAFAFARVKYGELSNGAAMLLLCVVGVVSVASYYLVERPARNRNVVKTRAFAPAAAAVFAMLFVSSGALYLTDGFAARYGELAQLFTETGAEIMDDDATDAGSAATGGADHAHSAPYGKLLLIGDSHAGVLKKATAQLAEKYAVAYEARALGSCATVDVEHIVFGDCDTFREATQAFIEKADPAIIIYTLHWRKYRDRSLDGKYSGSVAPHEGELLADAYARTFDDWLERGHKLLLISPGVESEMDVKELLKTKLDQLAPEERAAFMEQLNLEVGYDAQVARAEPERRMIEKLSQRDGVAAVDPLELFCDVPAKTCALNDGATLWITDITHYSSAAAQKIMGAVEQKLLSEGWLRDGPRDEY